MWWIKKRWFGCHLNILINNLVFLGARLSSVLTVFVGFMDLNATTAVTRSLSQSAKQHNTILHWISQRAPFSSLMFVLWLAKIFQWRVPRSITISCWVHNTLITDAFDYGVRQGLSKSWQLLTCPCRPVLASTYNPINSGERRTSVSGEADALRPAAWSLPDMPVLR